MARLWMCLLLLSPAAAVGAELQVELGPTVGLSTWGGDAGGGGELRLGVRFLDYFCADAALGEALHAVDRRMTTLLSLGVTLSLPTGRFRPRLRIFLGHQHEQGWVSVARSPLTMVVGIGDGIRHRAGVGASLGAEWTFHQRRRWSFFAAPSLTGTFFPDARLGPTAYFGLKAAVGVNFDLLFKST